MLRDTRQHYGRGLLLTNMASFTTTATICTPLGDSHWDYCYEYSLKKCVFVLLIRIGKRHLETSYTHSSHLVHIFESTRHERGGKHNTQQPNPNNDLLYFLLSLHIFTTTWYIVSGMCKNRSLMMLLSSATCESVIVRKKNTIPLKMHYFLFWSLL